MACMHALRGHLQVHNGMHVIVCASMTHDNGETVVLPPAKLPWCDLQHCGWWSPQCPCISCMRSAQILVNRALLKGLQVTYHMLIEQAEMLLTLIEAAQAV